jgi:hypothetical protein
MTDSCIAGGSLCGDILNDFMRALWKGTISFGLVTIPVSLYPATKREELKFRLLRKSDHSPVNYKRVAEADGKEVLRHPILMKTNDLKVYGKNSRTESIRKPAGFTGPFSNSRAPAARVLLSPRVAAHDQSESF